MTTKLFTDMIICLLGLPLLLQVILPGISSPMHLPTLLHLEGTPLLHLEGTQGHSEGTIKEP